MKDVEEGEGCEEFKGPTIIKKKAAVDLFQQLETETVPDMTKKTAFINNSLPNPFSVYVHAEIWKYADVSVAGCLCLQFTSTFLHTCVLK